MALKRAFGVCLLGTGGQPGGIGAGAPNLIYFGDFDDIFASLFALVSLSSAQIAIGTDRWPGLGSRKARAAMRARTGSPTWRVLGRVSILSSLDASATNYADSISALTLTSTSRGVRGCLAAQSLVGLGGRMLDNVVGDSEQ